MSGEVALLPCPNPWCTSRTPPLPIRSRMASNGWHVACACGVCSWSKPTEAEAIAAWNTRQQAEACATSWAGELYPANPSALEQSIAELEAFERDGTILCEVENEVSFTESLALCLHELKRLRSASPTEAPGSEGAPDEDWLTDVLDDSLDMDWTGRVGARAIIARWSERHE